MKRVLIGLVAGTALAAFAAPSYAVTVVVTRTIDLSTASLSPGSLIVSGATFAPVAIGDNDTLDYTINFSGTQAITVTDADSFLIKLRAVTGSTATAVQGSGVLTLLGTPSYTSNQAVYNANTNSVGTDGAGEFFAAETNFTALPGVVTFTGLHFVGSVDYVSPAVTTRNYNLPSLQVTGDTVTVSGAPASPGVPEPSSWALMMIGFGAIGGAMRRRRSLAVKAA